MNRPNRSPRPALRWVPALALCALAGLLPWRPVAPETPAGLPSERPAPEGAEEAWHVLELDGRPAGWALERWWRDGDRVITEEEISLRLARGDSTQEVSLAGRFEETAGGEPVSLWTRQLLGVEPTETIYRFRPDGVEAVRLQGGRERREILPVPEGEWLTPAAARHAEAAHEAAGDRRYEMRVIEPLEGPEPVTTTRVRLGDPSPEAAAQGAVTRWREESSVSPGVPSVVELDAEGTLVRSSTEIFGLDATSYRADRESALAAVTMAGAGPATEILVRTLVRPDRPIPDPGRVARAVYDLSLEDGSPVPWLPDSGAQRVEAGAGPGRLRVTVHRDPRQAPPASARPPEDSDEAARAGAAVPDDTVTGAHLSASLFVDHDDPLVRRLLKRQRPDDADPAPGAPGAGGAAESAAERARRLTRFVHEFVGSKDLDTGFASASQVVRSRSGDCTEHAVLLAALLRAEGIPARLVTGLAYLDEFAGAESVFGYHMWVQAAIDAEERAQSAGAAGRWIDLDPTLPWGFGATHIALGHSDLSGAGREPELDRLMPLYGKLRIEVVEIEHAPRAP
jgi:transglutaminase-like putative cysteine protease